METMTTLLLLRQDAKGEKNMRHTRMASCLMHCKYVSVLFTIFMKGPTVQQQSVTTPRQAGFLILSLG